LLGHPWYSKKYGGS